MSAALEHAPVIELEPRPPGGGGPGDPGSDDPGRGGGGDGDGETGRTSLYRLGIALALISVSSLFVSLAIIYYARSRTPEFWDPIHPPWALWLSTGILALSSHILELARRALAAGRSFVYRRRLAVTSFLGLAFLASQLLALSQLVERGVFLRGNPHASVFYVFTGAHGVHLLVGMVVLNWLLLRRGWTRKRHKSVTDTIAVYWHFMGVVWLGLFGMLLAL